MANTTKDSFNPARGQLYRLGRVPRESMGRRSPELSVALLAAAMMPMGRWWLAGAPMRRDDSRENEHPQPRDEHGLTEGDRQRIEAAQQKREARAKKRAENNRRAEMGRHSTVAISDPHRE